jgi:hypothetical protein
MIMKRPRPKGAAEPVKKKSKIMTIDYLTSGAKQTLDTSHRHIIRFTVQLMTPVLFAQVHYSTLNKNI